MISKDPLFIAWCKTVSSFYMHESPVSFVINLAFALILSCFNNKSRNSGFLYLIAQDKADSSFFVSFKLILIDSLWFADKVNSLLID